MSELLDFFGMSRQDILEAGTKDLLSMPCARPIVLTLRGGVNASTGEIGRGVGELERLEVRCRSTFYERCAPCAARSSRDAWMIGAAGISGLKSLKIPKPEEQYFYFLTLTAPSFGPVHKVGRCRCGESHEEDDELLHLPIDVASYDFTGAATFNLLAGRLWNRTVTRLKRVFGKDIQYLLATEPQKRGLVHYHVIARSPRPLDPLAILAEAAEAAVYTGPRRSGDEIRWGCQIDCKRIKPGGESGRQAVNYIFKAMSYTRKSTTDMQESQAGSAAAQEFWDRLETEANRLRISGEISGVKPLRTRRYGAFGGFTGHRLGRSRGWARLADGAALSLARLRALRTAWARRGEGESLGEAEYLAAEPQWDPLVQDEALRLRDRLRQFGSQRE
ncbi:replication initiator [Brachybacterium alimentarium]|uniref:replication initiator n=1 Tax=Brachybacterium alimentarium TaxID=47845 RepID=UPI003FD27915